VYTKAQEGKMSKRKRYTAEEKMKILREVLEDGKTISQVAENYSLHPNNLFNWRKQLFEGGLQAFQIKRTDISSRAEDRLIKKLEEKIKHKDEIIAELAGELLELKKNYSGLL
jgi:transposase-like protein